MTQKTEFEHESQVRLQANSDNVRLKECADSFLLESLGPKYSYNFFFLGRPIIQYPQDIVQIQHVIWDTKPDLVIETGVAHGGSLILSAAMLALLDLCERPDNPSQVGTGPTSRKVLGIDIDIRPHNRAAIEAHPLKERIELIEGSSTADSVVNHVKHIAEQYRRVMVILDSNHTHNHVLEELNAYGSLVSTGCYMVVFDTMIEKHPQPSDRPWGPNNSPMSAVEEYLRENSEFRVDSAIDNRLLISAAPRGYLIKQ